MQRHGWTLLFHEGVIEQLRKLQAAVERAERSDPQAVSYTHLDVYKRQGLHLYHDGAGERFWSIVSFPDQGRGQP